MRKNTLAIELPTYYGDYLEFYNEDGKYYIGGGFAYGGEIKKEISEKLYNLLNKELFSKSKVDLISWSEEVYEGQVKVIDSYE